MSLSMARPLTPTEESLIRWMLEHGHPDARAFLPQLERVSVADSQCPCGCASIDLSVVGAPEPTGGPHILADFLFGDATDLSGVAVFQKHGFLAGLEVYGLAGDAPKELPPPDILRPFETSC
jgi:hypothetical protein